MRRTLERAEGIAAGKACPTRPAGLPLLGMVLPGFDSHQRLSSGRPRFGAPEQVVLRAKAPAASRGRPADIRTVLLTRDAMHRATFMTHHWLHPSAPQPLERGRRCVLAEWE